VRGEGSEGGSRTSLSRIGSALNREEKGPINSRTSRVQVGERGVVRAEKKERDNLERYSGNSIKKKTTTGEKKRLP